jgi:hypothetical protein
MWAEDGQKRMTLPWKICILEEQAFLGRMTAELGSATGVVFGQSDLPAGRA